MKALENQAINYIGVDIAKDEIVCCLLINNQVNNQQTNSFKNSKSGHSKFTKWLHKERTVNNLSTLVIMEATSSYWKNFAHALHEAGISVSVVQPLRIAHFAKVLFKRSKSDPADAHTIALYGLKMNPDLWSPLSKIQQQIQATSRRLKQIQKQLNAEKNHLEHTSDSGCKKDIQAHIKQLEARITKLKSKLQEIVPKDPKLKAQSELLQTIQGVGAQSAAQIVAELPNLTEFESARQLAAWAGLTPKHHQSGNSAKARSPISKVGSNHLREALFFPALVGIRYNPLLKSFRDRLIENGKTKLQAVCACMRKLLHIIYGMIKHNQPFNPEYLNPRAEKTCPSS